MKRRIALWLVLAFVLSMIPATAFAELGNCPTCQGKGYTVCEVCEGSCKIPCDCEEGCERCGGELRIDCPACGGRGGFDCTTCGGSGHVHTFSTDWSHDEQTHWHAASCGHDVIADEGRHYDNDADGVCDVCGANLEEAPEPQVDPHEKDKCRKQYIFWKNFFKKAASIWKNTPQKNCTQKKTDFGWKNIIQKKSNFNWKSISQKKTDFSWKNSTKKSGNQIGKVTPKWNDVNSKKYEIRIHTLTPKWSDVNAKKSDTNSKKSETNSQKSETNAKKSQIHTSPKTFGWNNVNFNKNKFSKLP